MGKQWWGGGGGTYFVFGENSRSFLLYLQLTAAASGSKANMRPECKSKAGLWREDRRGSGDGNLLCAEEAKGWKGGEGVVKLRFGKPTFKAALRISCCAEFPLMAGSVITHCPSFMYNCVLRRKKGTRWEG